MSEDFKPREQEEDGARDEMMTDCEAREDKVVASVIYNVTDFYECVLAHTIGTRRFSTCTEEGIPVQSDCVARDACEGSPHMVVMMHCDAQLIENVLRAFDGVVLVLGDHIKTQQEQDRARVMFVNVMQFARCAPIRPEHSALEMFHYITTEMAYVQTGDHSVARTPIQLDAHNFVLGLQLLSASADSTMAGRDIANAGRIIDEIIADWQRAMDPSEIAALGRAHSIQIQGTIRARSEMARVMNIDITAPRADTETQGRARTIVEVKMFLCQDLIDHAHAICAGQSDVIMTYNVRSSNLEYVLTCSGERAREVIDVAIDGESEANPIIEGATGTGHIKTWTARATHAQMCAFVRDTVRA